jgi:polyhydroxybutyrate depolymerase
MSRSLLVFAVAAACVAPTLCVTNCLTNVFGVLAPPKCITHGGLQRCWYTYTPQSLVGKTGKAPAVMLIHGLTGCADFIGQQTGLLAEAERRGFFLVMPQGVFNLTQKMPAGQEFLANEPSWNAGPCCGAAQQNQTDDSGFLAKVVDETVATLPVNANRFYIAGHSNGAAMAARFAVEHSGKVTAVAAVSFFLLVAPTNAYTTKLPYLWLHGTDDTTVPFEGFNPFGAVANAGNVAAINGCTKGPRSQALTVSNKAYTRISYGGCDAPRSASEVVLVVVPNGTHQPFPLSGITQFDNIIKPDNFDSSKLACDFLFDYERTGSVITRTGFVSPSPDYDSTTLAPTSTSAPSTTSAPSKTPTSKPSPASSGQPTTLAPTTSAPSKTSAACQLLPSLALLVLAAAMR